MIKKSFVKQALLVIALSARPYAEAAKRSGFSVSVMDGFLDQETQAIADQIKLLSFDASGFQASELENALQNFDTQSFLGCIYGSGFEAHPALIDVIQQKIPILGNTATTVKKIKDAEYFFTTLDTLNILHPQIFTTLPNNQPCKQDSATPQYLVKSQGGAGGGHIRYADAQTILQPSEYLQTHIDGEPVSVLFLVENTASDFNTYAIGFNQQWLNPTLAQPYRFGGIASNADLSEEIKNNLIEIVCSIARAFGLVGLNSLDVIICDKKIIVLEVNPRLSASVELYAGVLLETFGIDLMQLHVESCLSEPFSEDIRHRLAGFSLNDGSSALGIVYAKNDVYLESVDWPAWAKDKPLEKTQIAQESPVCSVISNENSVLLAKSVAKSRVDWMTARLCKA